MDRKQTTEELGKLLMRRINPKEDPRIFTAREVTVDTGAEAPCRVDFMQFLQKNMTAGGIEQGTFTCFEVKSCDEDYNSGHGLNFIGDLNYLVTTRELYGELNEGNRLPWGVGVYVRDGDGLVCEKKAKREARKYAASTLLLSMYRSAQRDLLHAEKRLSDIGTLPEREKAMKPERGSIPGAAGYMCPRCWQGVAKTGGRESYCPRCGQKLKW